MLSLHSLLTDVKTVSASDVHAVVGSLPLVRVHGSLVSLVGYDSITSHEMESLVDELLDQDARRVFADTKEWGGAVQLSDGSRFRANLFFENGNPAFVARLIASAIPTLSDIGFPESAVNLINADRGLVLVTGQTGSGKSTTLAALVEYLNATTAKNIVTLEDPIEYVFSSKKSLVKQREVGRDINSFSESLKHIVRHDPDVIMVGEMRDPETIKAALTLAETGHLVLSTLHTSGAGQTVNRIIDSFSAEQQNQIRSQLALSLRGIISQRLVRSLSGGRVAVREILVNTPAIANLIREDKIEHIESVLQTSASQGMVTLDAALSSLYRTNTISYDVALEHATDVALIGSRA